MNKHKMMSGVASLLAAGAGALQAQSITVPNSSFESQAAPTSTPFVNINVDSWQKNPEPGFYEPAFGGSGVPWAGTAGVFFDTNPYANKLGSQLGYILAVPQVALFQDTSTGFNSATYQAGMVYTMTVGVFAKPNVAPGSTLALVLYYLDSSNNKILIAGSTITDNPGVFTVGTPLNLVDESVTAVIAPGDAAVGKGIGIEIESTIPIESTSFGNWDLDNVRLNGVVPEPTTMTLMALGTCGLFLARARRRA